MPRRRCATWSGRWPSSACWCFRCCRCAAGVGGRRAAAAAGAGARTPAAAMRDGWRAPRRCERLPAAGTARAVPARRSARAMPRPLSLAVRHALGRGPASCTACGRSAPHACCISPCQRWQRSAPRRQGDATVARTCRPDWSCWCASAPRSLGVHAAVRLLRSRERSMPMAFGTRRPAILIPAIADTWDEDRRRAVLLHELAHVARLRLPDAITGARGLHASTGSIRPRGGSRAACASSASWPATTA